MNVGDTVYIINWHFNRIVSVKEATIERLTPGGQKVLSNGLRLNKYGTIAGRYDRNIDITTDKEVAEKARGEVSRRQLVSRFGAIKWSEYPSETLQAVLALLERKSNETE